MSRFNPWVTICALFFLCIASAITSPAQTFNTIGTVPSDSNGDPPLAQGLIQGTDGNFYGVTSQGGTGSGTVFKVTPGGTVTTLYTFCSKKNCTDGANPVGTLLQGTDGNFYGATINLEAIGIHGCVANLPCGTIFKITPAGVLTTMHTFKGTDGFHPNGGLVQDIRGLFYGTTEFGGLNNSLCGTNGCGTAFKMSPTGVLTTLYSFCSQSNCADGTQPAAGLIQATDGSLFGMTFAGGNTSGACASVGCGTIFELKQSGALTTLHSFDETDGLNPEAALVQANDGNFYGTTTTGGSSGGGTFFRIAPNGHFASLASLPSGNSNNNIVSMVEGTDGNFYGEIPSAGTDLLGLLFSSTSGGTLTSLYNFTGGADSLFPTGILQATSGTFYGATAGGKSCESCNEDPSTIFTLGVGLGPFVALQHNAAMVGQTIGILSQGLTGTSAVSFNGTAAVFTVVSDTYLTATVPTGATTGFITVTTSGGALTSNQKFWVNP